MVINKGHELTRREFASRSAQLAILGSASTYALGLAGIGEAAAFANTNDYKALVCVFLYGGNDHANTLIPYDPLNYDRYQSIRRSIAISRDSLSDTFLQQAPQDQQQLTDDISYALHPSLSRLRSRFSEGDLAVLLNVGPLVAPITKEQFESGNESSYPRPQKLFSHNDQRATWQASGAAANATGWGGRLGDLAQAANQNSMFTAMNAFGNAVFLTGNRSTPFRVSPRGGAELIRSIESNRLFGSTTASEALKDVMTMHHQHVLEQDYATILSRSLTYSPFVDEVLSGTAMGSFASVNPLSSQLEVVSRLISGRERLGVQRQIFFVGLGGFDHHSNLLTRHADLLAQLDESLDEFYGALKSMGVASNVTTFTASDFGRTLSPNGTGSDHGWGGHSFILGGDVRGGLFYGSAPRVSVNSHDEVGRGRLLPSTSVDELASTLALWFGVSVSELPSVLPNIGRFARSDLGFMRRT